MDVAIAYFISCLSIFTLLTLWFTNAYKVLSQKREEVKKAQEELRLHKEGYQRTIGSMEEKTARHMLDTSTQIYKQIMVIYNNTFKNPIYRLPGFLMGFRTIN